MNHSYPICTCVVVYCVVLVVNLLPLLPLLFLILSISQAFSVNLMKSLLKLFNCTLEKEREREKDNLREETRERVCTFTSGLEIFFSLFKMVVKEE